MQKSTITVGTNWSREFIEEIDRLNKTIGSQNNIRVGEVYGSLSEDKIGTARSKDRLHKCDYDKLEEHIRICHDKGIKVVYANNALCMGSNISLDNKFDLFLDHTHRLTESGIDAIIFSLPFFVEQTRKQFPDMDVFVSTIAHVETVKMVDYYQRMGAKRIILPLDVNRNFQLLKTFTSYDKPEFELIMTDACIYECPYRQNHFASQSHDSIEGKGNNRHAEVKHYPFDRCWEHLTQDWPAEFLKSRWIRPEDMSVYEGFGYHHFKISGRTLGERWILKSVRAYLSREWRGNLLEIFPIIPGKCELESESPLVLPNESLAGFLDHFIANGQECSINCGTRCDYCDAYARGYGGKDGRRT